MKVIRAECFFNGRYLTVISARLFHPLDVCMFFSQYPSFFETSGIARPVTQEEAMDTLRRAAEAGLVHSVSNNQEGLWYVCNCCTCACGVLRAMTELGMSNVIARSSFVNQVDEDLCIACGVCVDLCQFDAIVVDGVAQIDEVRCVGCGVCTLACPQEAMTLVARPEGEVLPPPLDEKEWQRERAKAREIDIEEVL